MSEKGCQQNGKSSWVQKEWQNARSWDASTRRVECRDCSRLPEKKTRISVGTFEGKKKKEENRGNREVETSVGRESTRV